MKGPQAVRDGFRWWVDIVGRDAEGPATCVVPIETEQSCVRSAL